MLPLLLALSLSTQRAANEARPDPCPDILPGRWTLTIGETPFAVTLFPDGRYECGRYGEVTYQGAWSFDRRSRRFTVVESSTFHRTPIANSFWVILDHRLMGHTPLGSCMSLDRKE